jgi:Protein of unknown function (DUF4240)
MNIDEFWNIVERVHAASPHDMKNKCRLLADELRGLSAEEVVSFGKHFADCFYKLYHWDVWGAAFVINHGCGDDSFMDFRSTLISLGRGPFEAAVRDADSLADFDIDPAWARYEGYQYVPPQVYKEKEGGEDPPSEGGPRHPKTVAGVPFVEWELSKRFPRLAAKYGHKDSDWSVEKEYAARLEKKEQRAAVIRRIMLEGIIPSCGVIPPYRVVAKILRTGRSPESLHLHRTWERFDFDESAYWAAAFGLLKVSPAELNSRPDLRGVKLKIDHSAPRTDDFQDWMRTLGERGLA